ncbi:hypothetical protein FH972_016816 [Carpinus fangiana]|uniref:Uncharacterized protein n=1 Tax=Carpinus fangiana TaxID=176857 RepID=A0A5N6RKI3_9ROSI|nr:hypothetical protein FH972_016816 [Carpinus fangiana]
MEEAKTATNFGERTPAVKVGRKRSLREDLATLSLNLTATKVSEQPSSSTPSPPPTPFIRKKRRCHRSSVPTTGESFSSLLACELVGPIQFGFGYDANCLAQPA